MDTIISVFTLIFSLASLIISIYTFNRKSWSEQVSSSRMNWITEFRNDISFILSSNNSLNEETIKSIYRVRLKLNLVTDHNVECNVLLDRVLVSILNNPNLGISNYDKEKIFEYTKIILEYEWSRVKKEARGKERS